MDWSHIQKLITSDIFLASSNFQASWSNGRRQTVPHDDPNRGQELMTAPNMPKAAAPSRRMPSRRMPSAECRARAIQIHDELPLLREPPWQAIP